MFVWAKYPSAYRHLSSVDFAMMLLEEGNVACSPGSGFGPAGEGYVRMALVENENRLKQAVRNLARVLEKKAQMASKEAVTAYPLGCVSFVKIPARAPSTRSCR